MKATRWRPRLALWWRWLLAGALGGAIGGISAVILPLGEVVTSGTVGQAQWRLLRRYLPKARLWVRATTIGGSVGLTLAVLVAAGIVMVGSGTRLGRQGTIGLWIAASIVGGMVVGVAQWLVLRHHVRRAGWWLAAASVGAATWPAAMAAGWLVGSSASRLLAGLAGSDGIAGSLVALVQWMLGGAVAMALSWAGYGAVTGIVLVWLLQDPQPEL